MKQATSPCGRSDWDCSLCLVRPTRGRQTTIVLSPSVVRGFAPPTDGYDASDLLRGPIYRSGRRGSERSERPESSELSESPELSGVSELSEVSEGAGGDDRLRLSWIA